MTKGLRTLFWGIPSIDQMPFPQFLDMFRGGGSYIISARKEGELVGIGTLCDIFGVDRVNVGIWLEPKMRGVNSHLIGRELLIYVHGHLGFKNIYATTPWNAAKMFCTRIGMYSVAELPKYCVYNGRYKDVEIFMSELPIVRKEVEQLFEDRGWDKAMAEAVFNPAPRKEVEDG